eukprot:1162009-Pelagomonas_calceolata.AAC.13
MAQRFLGRVMKKGNDCQIGRVCGKERASSQKGMPLPPRNMLTAIPHQLIYELTLKTIYTDHCPQSLARVTAHHLHKSWFCRACKRACVHACMRCSRGFAVPNGCTGSSDQGQCSYYRPCTR